jgi:hypothetical protein
MRVIVESFAWAPGPLPPPSSAGVAVPTKITPTRQRNGVSEGMAFGLALLGRQSLRFEKLRVDLAFDNAWRDWPYRSRFPQVSTDLRNGSDGVWVMTTADERKRTFVFFWVVNRELVVVQRQPDWDVGDADDVAYATKMMEGDVPAEGWRSLAETFLRAFEP